MRALFLAWFFSTIAATIGHSQDIQSLRAPSTPAFSILNFEPSSILKPSSLKDIGGDIMNSFDANGKLKMNLGLEFTPYWLSSRPYLTFEQYTKPKLGQVFLQTLNISAATVRDSVNKKDKFGVGIRFQLKNGEPHPEYINKQKILKNRLSMQSIATIGRANVSAGVITTTAEAKDFFSDFIKDSGTEFSESEKEELQKIFNETIKNFTDNTLKEFFEALNLKLNEVNSPLVTKVAELSKKRVGLFLEFAGATGFSSSTNNQTLERAGVWFTTSYYYKTGDSWFASARYQFSNRDTSQNNFDFGFSYAKELKSFSLSTEGMFRWYRATIPDLNINNQRILRLEKDFTWRFALQGTYLISDGISFNLSLGKDFDSPFVSREGFFSIFGLNYALFRKVPTKVSSK